MHYQQIYDGKKEVSSGKCYYALTQDAGWTKEGDNRYWMDIKEGESEQKLLCIYRRYWMDKGK